MKEKTLKKRKTGTVTLDPTIVDDASAYCRTHGIILKFFVEEAIKEKLKKDKSK